MASLGATVNYNGITQNINDNQKITLHCSKKRMRGVITVNVSKNGKIIYNGTEYPFVPNTTIYIGKEGLKMKSDVVIIPEKEITYEILKLSDGSIVTTEDGYTIMVIGE
jgi:5-keto 4-deoxyuronate isomerase